MKEKLQLPPQVVTPSDVARLLRELGVIEDFLDQARLRQGGQPVAMPVLSARMESVCNLNGLNLLQSSDREQLSHFLKFLKNDAPSVHISFAIPTSPQSIQKLIMWLRQNTDPMMLVQIGLSPAIVAGCVMRTSNRQFDFSLQHQLAEKKPLLIDHIRKLDTGGAK